MIAPAAKPVSITVVNTKTEETETYNLSFGEFKAFSLIGLLAPKSIAVAWLKDLKEGKTNVPSRSNHPRPV